MSVESESIRERIRAAIGSQTQSNVNVLSSLHAVLDDLGYIPQEAIEEVADQMATTINEVWGVASFYTNFRFTPPGDNIVEICWGPTCTCSARLTSWMRCKRSLGLPMRARPMTTESA